MKNVKVKLTLWGIIVVAGIVFFVQNRSPEIALVIFGSETAALPAALWLIIGAIAGLITSIVLQLLLGVYSGRNKRSRQWDGDGEEDEFEFPETEEENQEQFASSTRFSSEPESNVSTPEEDNSSQQDWQSPPRKEDWNDIDDDWNIEEPPRRDSNAASNRRDDIYEVPNSPEKTSRQGSVYSYRYREARREYYDSEAMEPEQEEDDDDNNDDDDEFTESPQVYEANYRVIRPPLWNLPDTDDNRNEEEDDQDKR